MPPHQVDLETLVAACSLGGSDSKTACETKLDDGDGDYPAITAVSVGCDAADDLPPGSFWLSKDSEYDWFEHRSYCYEREDSTKGNNSSKNPNNPSYAINPNSNSNSQRFSVTVKSSKAPIIGLPHSQKATFLGPKRRACNKPASVRLFPAKRSGSSGKSTGQVNEPGSPKVSCMGRVRSKRCRRRSNSVRRSGDEKAAVKVKKPGLCSRVLDIFRSKKKGRRCKETTSRSGSRRVVVGGTATVEKAQPVEVRRSVSMRAGSLCEPEPPGLGGMKRFSSGRRSCSALTGEEVG